MLWANRHIVFAGLCFGWMLQAGSVLAQEILPSHTKRLPSNEAASLGQSSGKLIPNRGQLADQFGKPMPEVLYSMKGRGVKCYFTKHSMHYVFSKFSGTSALSRRETSPTMQGMVAPERDTLSLYRVDLHFLAANPEVTITAEDSASDYTNYYLPSCPDGITHVPAFQRIIYHDLYPHIDMAVYSGNGDMDDRSSESDHYDFIVHPGGDPNQIRVEYDGQDSLVLSGEGNLRVTSPFGEVTELAPSSFQGEWHVASRYVLRSSILSYKIGTYDRARDLIIDPQRLWGTYFGGPDTGRNTFVQDLGVDHGGNIDIAGYTNSLSNIATTGAFQTTYGGGFYDGFVARFEQDGSLRWATYYGGGPHDTLIWPTSGNDNFQAIACDNSLGIVAAGQTSSVAGITSVGAFQTTLNAISAAMLVSFDSNGARRWATYYSGNGLTSPPGESNTQGTGVAIDSLGNIILIGSTNSTGGIATSGAYQTIGSSPTYCLFLAKFSSGGSRLWGTYFGGGGGENSGWVSVDVNNNIYFTASTASTSKIATPGAFQATPGPSCIAKFSPAGAISWATYYLSKPHSFINRLVVTRAGTIYLAATADTAETGIATPGAYQVTKGGGTDGLVSKFSTGGNRIWATYYGGDSDDYLLSLALDTSENIFAGGYTYSSNRIASSMEYQTSLLGPYDPFLMKFDSSGQKRFWATYYGRRGWASSIGLDHAGHPYVGGTTTTGGTEFSTSGAYKTTPLGAANGFLAKFCDPAEVHITSTEVSPICPNTPVTLSVPKGFASYEWLINNRLISGANTSSYSFLTPSSQGIYDYTVNVIGTDFCSAISDTIHFYVRQAPQVALYPVDIICPGSSIQLQARVQAPGSLTYSWTPAATLDHPDSLQPIATPSVGAGNKPTTYTLAVTDTNGCTTTIQATVYFYPAPQISFAGGSTRTDCGGAPIALTAAASGGMPPYTYSWSPSSTLNRTDSSTVIATPSAGATSAKYFVIVTDARGCSSRDSVLLQISMPPQIVVGPPLSICRGSSIKIGATISGKPPYIIAWSPAASLNDSTIAQPTASPSATTRYTLSVTDKNGCVSIDSVLVTVADSLTPTVTANGPLTICTGDTVHLTAGTGYTTYMWSGGETTPDLAVTKSGNYFVHVTSGAGCAGTSNTVQVQVLPDSVPKPILTASATTICSGDSIQLALTNQYSFYRWNTGDSTETIVVKEAGSYSVTATNAAGCSGTSAPLAITVVPAPSVTINANGPTTFCSGSGALADSILLLATPGTSGSYAFNWSNGDSTPAIVVKNSGSYSVTVTNAAGCTASSTPVAVTVNPSPNPAIVGPASACPNSTTAYSVANVSNDTYAWTLTPAGAGTIANPSSASTSIQWSLAGAATLSLTESGPDGCSTTAQLPVSITSNLTPLVSGPMAVCSGDSIMLDAGTGYTSYQWSRDGNVIVGATNDSLSVGQAGNYTVFVTSGGGCSGTSAPAAITIYPLPAKPIISQTGSVLHSTPSAHYQWSFAGSMLLDSVNQTIEPDSQGAYMVTITDANGCSSTSDPYLFSTAAYASVSVPRGMLVSPGATVSIPLTLDSSNGLATKGATNYIASIGLDATMLTPIAPIGVLVGTHWVVSLAGQIAGGAPASSPVLLQTITALAADSGLCTGLTIDTFYFTAASIPVTEENGLVCLAAPCTPILHTSDTAFTIKRVSPNPTEASFVIDYHVAASGPFSMELDDYLGRTVTVLKHGWSEAGDCSETYSVQNISSGLYRLVLRSVSAGSGTRTLGTMLVVTK